MKKNEKKIKVIELSSLKYNKNNPSIVIDSKFHKLVNSIKDFSKMMQIREIVVDENNISLGGNKRLKAINVLVDLVKSDENIFSNDKVLRGLLLKGKIPSTWVKKIEGLSDKEKREFVIKDNISFGEWDWELLMDEDGEWDANDLEDWGLDIPDFVDETDAEAVEDNFEIPEEMQVDIVIGDLIQIGEHMLLCGDSTDSDAVAKLMDGEKADMVFTDPPYGVSYQSNMRTKTKKFDVLQNDDVFIVDWIPNLQLFSKGFVFVWTSWKVMKDWIEFCDIIGDLSNLIIWDKGGGGIGDLKKTFLTDFEVALVYNRGAEIIGKRLGSVWSVHKDAASSYLHPTQKPIELASLAISNLIKKGAICLDLFLGSGSTMVAAHQLKRKCYGMEIDPKYCQVIIERMQKLDSNIIVKINGIEYDKTV